MNAKFFLKFVVIAIILTIGLSRAPKAGAYYGGGLYGMGMYGMGGLYGMGMYGMGGLYGMGMYGMGGPFSIYNMYYPVETGAGLTYQLPFMMALPYIGMSKLYGQLFPNLFGPQTTTSGAAATSVL